MYDLYAHACLVKIIRDIVPGLAQRICCASIYSRIRQALGIFDKLYFQVTLTVVPGLSGATVRGHVTPGE